MVSRADRFAFDLKLNAVPRGLSNSYGAAANPEEVIKRVYRIRYGCSFGVRASAV